MLHAEHCNAFIGEVALEAFHNVLEPLRLIFFAVAYEKEVLLRPDRVSAAEASSASALYPNELGVVQIYFAFLEAVMKVLLKGSIYHEFKPYHVHLLGLPLLAGVSAP